MSQPTNDPEIAGILQAAMNSENRAMLLQSVLAKRIAGSLTDHAAALTQAGKDHAAELKAATENMIMEMQRQARAMSEATDRIVGGMKDHSSALGRATTASDKYAGRLVWATWALVLATAGLIIVTWEGR
jgi:hypothetical protein